MTSSQCGPSGLMAQIQALINPSSSHYSSSHLPKKKSSSNSIASKCNRKSNNEYCDSCNEGGMLLCCDRCPAAFHLLCNVPPLEIEDVPKGQWICYKCTNLEKTSDFDLNMILTSLKYSPLNQSFDNDDCKDSIESTIVDDDNCNEDEEDYQLNDYSLNGPIFFKKSPDEAFSMNSPDTLLQRLKAFFNIFSQHAKLINPHQYELPAFLTESNPFVSPKKQIFVSDQYSSNSKSFNLLTASQNSHSKQTRNASKTSDFSGNGSDPDVICVIPKKHGPQSSLCLCYKCHKSCQKAPLIKCDFCPLAFHADCLDPPLTTLPIQSTPWMCPIHPYHFLEKKFLKDKNSLSEKIKLWNRFSNFHVDPKSIADDFLRKIQNENFDFECTDSKLFEDLVLPETNVPSSIKDAYAHRKELLPLINLESKNVHSKPILEHNFTNDEQKEFIQNFILFQRSFGEKQMVDSNEKISPENVCDTILPQEQKNASSEIFNDTLDTKVNNSHYLKNGFLNCDSSKHDSSETLHYNFNTNHCSNKDNLQKDNCEIQIEAVLQNGYENEMKIEVEDQDCQNILYDNLKMKSIDFDLIESKSEHNFQNNSNSIQMDNSDGIKSSLPSLAVLCQVYSSQNVSASKLKTMTQRTFTIGTCSESNLILNEFGFCNKFSSKHAVIIYDVMEKTFQLINYSEHGTIVDNVLYSLDISYKPSRIRNLYRSIDDVTICGIKDLIKKKRLSKQVLPNRIFSREKNLPVSDSTLTRGREHNDLVEINAILSKQNCSNFTPSVKAKRSATEELKPVTKKWNQHKEPGECIQKRKYRKRNLNLENNVEIKVETLSNDDYQDNFVDNQHDNTEILNSNSTIEKLKTVNCKCDDKLLQVYHRNGWEGSAILHHGSLIQIGCLQFVFSITAHG